MYSHYENFYYKLQKMSEKKQYIINYYLTLSPEQKIIFVQQLIQKYWSGLDIKIPQTESESNFFIQYLFADNTEQFLQNNQKKIHKNIQDIFSKIKQLQTTLTLKILHNKEQKEKGLFESSLPF